MVAAAPAIDTSSSKTVNVPADYLHAEFEDLYMRAWKSGLKGLATYRPGPTGCQVLKRIARDCRDSFIKTVLF